MNDLIQVENIIRISLNSRYSEEKKLVPKAGLEPARGVSPTGF